MFYQHFQHRSELDAAAGVGVSRDRRRPHLLRFGMSCAGGEGAAVVESVVEEPNFSPERTPVSSRTSASTVICAPRDALFIFLFTFSHSLRGEDDDFERVVSFSPSHELRRARQLNSASLPFLFFLFV